MNTEIPLLPRTLALNLTYLESPMHPSRRLAILYRIFHSRKIAINELLTSRLSVLRHNGQGTKSYEPTTTARIVNITFSLNGFSVGVDYTNYNQTADCEFVSLFCNGVELCRHPMGAMALNVEF